MKIYIAHSKSFDFETELYEPIKNSSLFSEHTFIFPHSEGEEIFNSKQLFQEGCDLVIAEVSFPTTGLGIELGWADSFKIPIVCIYRNDVKLSKSLSVVTNTFLEYSSSEELISKIGQVIKDN